MEPSGLGEANLLLKVVSAAEVTRACTIRFNERGVPSIK
jgi:hypothetical protein